MDANSTATNVTEPILAQVKDEIFRFVVQVQAEPLAALTELPHVAIGLFLILALPSLFALVWSLTSAPSPNKAPAPVSSEGLPWQKTDPADVEEFKKAAAAVPVTEAPWLIGYSAKAVSVTEDGNLRAIDFTYHGGVPTVEDVEIALLKAIVRPMMGQPAKPKIAAFLASRTCDDKLVQAVGQAFESFKVRITTVEESQAELEELKKKRGSEHRSIPGGPASVPAPGSVAAVGAAAAAAAAAAPAPDKKPEFIKQPNRGCFVCHQDIDGKPSQCSACKAVIYCGPACAKKDWPQHKLMCPSFKANMARLENESLHNMPFTYYSSSAKHLSNYNQMPFLVNKERHNMGLYRRLCNCYNQFPFGELTGENAAQIQNNNITDPKAKFDTLALPDELYPLNKALPDDVDPRSVDSWQKYFEAKGLPFDSPVALILEVPLTIWHLLNTYYLKDKAIPEKLTIHLIGVEKEADLIPLFEILTAFMPNTKIVIHMIGPAISKRLRPEHRTYHFTSHTGKGSLSISLRPEMYIPPFLEGTAPEQEGSLAVEKPDVIIGLNTAFLAYQTWIPSLKMIIDKKQPSLFTEGMEQALEQVNKNLPMLGGTLSILPQVNPFRQPLFQFKKDMNLPAWSNGFICGVN
ncbi:uncharacterized protein BJ171DRAFT_199257 [Polychytrium aggregatum]|uniref:uncharacterized protein n=1 Tax=Polychytrium aggregatum TaxID=110093 RepID=UPI0022FDB4D3|nr:uncharacterized protein BJ171DRAFT_199257 [Polychytrium aggregatum]KAI9199856.1 hypothetical protein BJ171DRAFT_199257 [Polychytrium aggregatum]